GEPQTMQNEPYYHNVLQEVSEFFEQRITDCLAAGIDRQKLILDPGVGFGKTLYHNYHLLANLSHFHHFDLPLLVGLSRKSMIGKVHNAAPQDRMIGSVSGAVSADMQAAKINRVHDVTHTVDAMRIVEATLAAKD